MKSPLVLGAASPLNPHEPKDFDDAKKTRNLVTHQGRKVSASDARFVIQTVYKLLQYLGSTLELEIALMSLKRYMEDNVISVQTEDEAVALVSNYFGQSKAAYAYTDLPKITSPKNRPQLRCELVLEFGKYRILVETRLVKASETPNLFGQQMKRRAYESTTRQSVFHDLVDEVYGVLDPLDLTQGAIIVFVDHDSEMPPDDRFTLVRRSRGFELGFWNSQRRAITELELVQKYHDGRVHAVVVNIHRQPSAEGAAIN